MASQTVLIHSACGGVGLAALQIARLVGANIYCTVGSEKKVRYLVDNYQIDRSHIFNSRDSSFLPAVMAATEGRGVDVVLNSLSGELLEASWKCVAEFGTMIEIGKRDFRRRAKLAMEAFEANRTFVGLDLYQVAMKQPKKAAEYVLASRSDYLMLTVILDFSGAASSGFEAAWSNLWSLPTRLLPAMCVMHSGSCRGVSTLGRSLSLCRTSLSCCSQQRASQR